MIDNIQIPIRKLAESPKASESVMTISARDNLPLSDAIIQTLRVLAHDATDSKTKPKKSQAANQQPAPSCTKNTQQKEVKW